MVADPDPYGSALFLEVGFRSPFKSNFRSFRGSKKSRRRPWTLTMEAWMVCRPVIADSHDKFDNEQDPDPHECEKLDPH